MEVGERIAIIGENGVGKTTLLNTLRASTKVSINGLITRTLVIMHKTMQMS